MQAQNTPRRSSGTKAIALDERARIARYRLYLFLSLILSAALALGLHVIFGH